jgi:hypothetical protein
MSERSERIGGSVCRERIAERSEVMAMSECTERSEGRESMPGVMA